jgi:hypothetical protein
MAAVSQVYLTQEQLNRKAKALAEYSVGLRLAATPWPRHARSSVLVVHKLR